MSLPPVKPLVSVILTSYNYETFVTEAIRSVLAQSWRPLELIVVDDGSTDRSPSLIRAAVADAPIPVKTVFRSNGGQASAFNAGLAQAAGSIVSFLDSDDAWLPERVEKVVQCMELVPGGAIYQHQLAAFDGVKRGGLVSADLFRLWRQWDDGVLNLADDKCGLLVSPFLPTSGLTFPRAVLDQIFPVPESLVTCPDAYLTRTAIAFGPLISIPLVLGRWRDHDRNAGKGEQADFAGYWLPNVLPALNAFYEQRGLGLRLVFNPQAAARSTAARMLGETQRWTGGQPVASVRRVLDSPPPGAAGRARRIGDLLRVVFSERVVSALSRLRKRLGPRREVR